MANLTDVRSHLAQRPVTGVSVVIPCKNEQGAVGQTVRELHEAFAATAYDYEIIIVDDGSTDASGQEALEAGAHVLVHEKNIGYGASIMDGIKAAKFPAIAIMDADGTYPATMLQPMLQRLTTSNLVIGARQWKQENTTAMALAFRRLLYFVILYLTSVRAPDFNSGLRVFWKDEIEKFWGLLCPTFSFTTTMTLLYLMTLRNVQFMPIDYAKRIGRSHVHYLRDAFRTLMYVLLIANLFKIYRLTLAVILGMVASNVVLAAFLWLLGVGTVGAVVSHMVLTSAFFMAMMAFNTMLETTIYGATLHRHAEDAG